MPEYFIDVIDMVNRVFNYDCLIYCNVISKRLMIEIPSGYSFAIYGEKDNYNFIHFSPHGENLFNQVYTSFEKIEQWLTNFNSLLSFTGA